MTMSWTWLTPETVVALGWTLLHSLWQITALAALAALAMAACRGAWARYTVAMTCLALMLIAPFVTFSLLWEPHTASSSSVSAFSSSEGCPNPVHGLIDDPVFGASSTEANGSIEGSVLSSADLGIAAWLPSIDRLAPSPKLLLGLVYLWMFGVVLLGLRTAGGFWLLGRMRRQESAPLTGKVYDACRVLHDALGITRRVRFRVASWVSGPVVIGVFRPIVFLPMTALTGLSEAQLRVVIAHELAHVRRWDALFNLVQVASETLLFFHPAVWWLNRRIRTEREHCCDDLAVSVCRSPVEFARALVLMAEWRSTPALAMAATGGSLSDRIVRLLNRRAADADLRSSRTTAGWIVVAIAIITGYGLVEAHRANAAAASSELSELPASIQSAEPSEATRLTESTESTEPTRSSGATQSTPELDQESGEPAGKERGQEHDWQDFGFDSLSRSHLAAFKVHGVAPQFVRAVRVNGFDPDAKDIVAMRVHGIGPDYVRDMTALVEGATKPDRMIGLKVAGVTPKMVRDLRALEFRLDADEAIAMRVHGVTAEFVAQLRATGIQLDADEVIAFAVHNVTPAYVQGLFDLGLEPDADNVIGLKVHGIDHEFVRRAMAQAEVDGERVTPDRLIGWKIHGWAMSGPLPNSRRTSKRPETGDRPALTLPGSG